MLIEKATCIDDIVNKGKDSEFVDPIKIKINNLKISLFSSRIAIKITKSLNYLLTTVLFWKLWSSEYIFAKQWPHQIFLNYFINWSQRGPDELLSSILTLAFVLTITFTYLWVSNKFINWLNTIEVPANYQYKLLKGNHFILDSRYSAKRVGSITIEGCHNSFYVALKGILHVTNENNELKQVKFICYSHSQSLQEYLLFSKFKENTLDIVIYFREKLFWKWENFIVLTFVLLSFSFVKLKYNRIKEHGINVRCGEALSGEVARRQKEIERKEKEELEQKEVESYFLNPEEIKESWENIGGSEEAKSRLKDVAQSIKDKLKEKKGYLIPHQHVLLYGPPGTGKTSLAKAMAKEVSVPFAYAKGSIFAGKVEEAEKKLVKYLEMTSKKSKDKPYIFFIDEFSEVGGEGSVLKTIMSGIEEQKYGDITIVAATNKIKGIDTALFRSGRFEVKQFITYPDKDDIRDVIEVNLKSFYRAAMEAKDSVLLGNRDEDSFVKEFKEIISKEISENKNYQVNIDEHINLGYDSETGKVISAFEDKDKPEPRFLFVGADIYRIIFVEAPRLAKKRSDKTLTKEDFIKSLKLVSKDNRKLGLQGKEMSGYLEEMVRIDGKLKGRL